MILFLFVKNIRIWKRFYIEIKMAISQYQKFEILTIFRNQINFAYYNPRKISEVARKKLKNKIKEKGLMQSLVWNKQTGNLVSGHQRLAIIDQLENNQDYELTVNVIDESLEEEIKDNVFFNNTSAMGEFDKDILENIKIEFPDIDFINDLGFDNLDLNYMNIEIENFNNVKINNDINKDLQEIKKNDLKNKKQKAIEQGDSYLGEQNDYILTIVFNTNKDKGDFNKKIGIDIKEKYCKYSKIYDISKDEFRI